MEEAITSTTPSEMESKQNGTFDLNVTLLEDIFGPRRDSLYIVIPITVIYCIIFFTGLIGNISTCIVIARNKSMHTATNYYLFSLAISDLLLLISGLPQEMYSIWSRYPYVFGYTFCVLRGLCSETSANATVLTITAFTVERYVAICHPFLSHTLAKLSRIVKLILLIWIIAVCFAVPQAVQFGTMPMMEGRPESIMCHVVNPIFEHSFEVSTFLFFIAPMTLITVLYVLIGIRLRSSTNMMKKDIGDCAKNFGSRGSCAIPKMGTRHQNSKASRRVLKMLVAVVVAFFICWAPFHAQRLFAIYVTPSSDVSDDDHYLKIYEIMTYVSGILYYFSTTINPLLYNIMSNKFREAFKETFTRCFHLGRPGRTERSYSVLSRSAQRGPDSTDSGKEDPSIHTHMSLVRKNSMDAAVVSYGTGCRPPHDKRLSESNSNDVDKIRWPKDRCDIHLSVVPKHNYENIQPGTKLVAVHVHSTPPRKFGSKFLQLFHCLAKRTLDDGKKLTTYYSSPAKETHTALELERTTKRTPKQETFSLTSGEISDSSLRDIENDALEDELNSYMLELHRCELR